MVVVLMCFVFLMGLGVGYVICDSNTIRRINEVKATCKRLNEPYKAPEVIKPKYDMTAEVDFNKLDVFSVERNLNGETIIGYWKDDVKGGLLVKETGQWYLPIDDEQHLRFIEKLRKQIGGSA
jgi:hypothetical protein